MWSIYIIRLKVKLKILYQYIIYRQFSQFSQYRQFSYNNLKEEKWKVFMEAVACWIKRKEKKQKQKIIRIKETTPDQNAINLTSTELLESQKSLLRKEPSFVPTPSDFNWHEVRRDFDKFANQLQYTVTHSTEITSSQEILSETSTADNITSGWNTAIENLSIYIVLVLFESSESMPSRIKNSNHLLDIIYNINSIFLSTNNILVSFDIVNMVPNIDNKSGSDAAKFVLLKRSTYTPPVECISEGSELWNSKDCICPTHTVILQCLNLILQLYNIISANTLENISRCYFDNLDTWYWHFRIIFWLS